MSNEIINPDKIQQKTVFVGNIRNTWESRINYTGKLHQVIFNRTLWLVENRKGLTMNSYINLFSILSPGNENSMKLNFLIQAVRGKKGYFKLQHCSCSSLTPAKLPFKLPRPTLFLWGREHGFTPRTSANPGQTYS